MAQDSQDIVDVAVENGSFTTLVAAVQQAELVDALKAEGPYTVFAPPMMPSPPCLKKPR
jgi:uncharacterized surface protein with fasciclin (FAS1) repeats